MTHRSRRWWRRTRYALVERSSDRPAEVLGRLEGRLHILDPLVRVLEDPHELLDVLLGAADVASARAALREHYGIDDIQAAAVLDMQLRQLPPGQQRRIARERDETRAQLEAERR
ncbi:DNA gyrase subunit A [Nocardioides conyzicola]|uniref:DNA topoisomerase (ATP-hydrolyzing) n=1 Tax=Nocardioides conyzicola TaxID=1651781 RepID=A0ABP8Y1R4_9ACTN